MQFILIKHKNNKLWWFSGPGSFGGKLIYHWSKGVQSKNVIHKFQTLISPTLPQLCRGKDVSSVRVEWEVRVRWTGPLEGLVFKVPVIRIINIHPAQVHLCSTTLCVPGKAIQYIFRSSYWIGKNKVYTVLHCKTLAESWNATKNQSLLHNLLFYKCGIVHKDWCLMKLTLPYLQLFTFKECWYKSIYAKTNIRSRKCLYIYKPEFSTGVQSWWLVS